MADQQTGMTLFNVQASINAYLSSYFQTTEFYTWGGSRPPVVFWFNDASIEPPVFAVAHLPSRFDGERHSRIQPTIRGMRVVGTLEVSCFVDKTDYRWVPLLSQMVDLTLMALSIGVIIVYDYGSDPSVVSPPVVGKVTLTGGRVVPLYTEDPNPSIGRSRVLGDYEFTHQTQV